MVVRLVASPDAASVAAQRLTNRVTFPRQPDRLAAIFVPGVIAATSGVAVARLPPPYRSVTATLRGWELLLRRKHASRLRTRCPLSSSLPRDRHRSPFQAPSN